MEVFIMKTWTAIERYQPYAHYSQHLLTKLEKQQQDSIWHLVYHIQPKSGLLNDPNGFSFFNNKWHLFYQSFPYGAVNGLRSWVHLTSTDLTHWKHEKTSLLPDTQYETHGAYSGSALPMGDQLFLMYTGNVRTANWGRHAYQLGAWMNKEGDFYKLPTPLINQPLTNFTQHFRDPKIIHHGNNYFAFLGARRADDTGHVLVYKAPKVTGPWSYVDELHFGSSSLGYMIECPNLVFINQHPVFIFCPQGLSKQKLSYENIYPNTYIVGDSFNWDTLTIVNPSSLHNFDSGFDLYATQAFNTANGETYAIGWAGLPETKYPSDQENWQGSLSLVRKLSLQRTHLIQSPITTDLIDTSFDPINESLDLQEKVSFSFKRFPNGKLILQADHSDNRLTIFFDSTNATVKVDRDKFGKKIGSKFGTTRTVKLTSKTKLDFTLYLDKSIFELYLNGGSTALTGRYFPDQADTYHLDTSHLKSQKFDVQGWRLKSI